MKKIALWGFGMFGRELLPCLRAHWADSYEVTLLCDRLFPEGTDQRIEGLPVCAPSELEALFRAGAFEAVLPSVADFEQTREIRAFLDTRAIPVCVIGREEDFIPASSLEGAEPQWQGALPEGYRCTLHRNLYAVSALQHTPFLLYDGSGHALIDNCDNSGPVSSGTLFLQQYPAPLDRVPGESELLQGRYCVIGKKYPTNYWHFTYDALDQLFLLEKLGFQGKYILRQSAFSEYFLDLLGVDRRKILWREELTPGQIYRIEELLVLNSDRESRFAVRAPVMAELAERIKKQLVPDTEHIKYPSRVYFKRVGTRKLLGAEELLRKYGFVEVTPENLTLREQMELFRSADIVFCPHGAGSTNSLYMRRGSVFIESFGRNWAVPHCTETLYYGGVYHLPVIQTPIFHMDRTHWLDDYSISPFQLEMALRAAVRLAGEADGK